MLYRSVHILALVRSPSLSCDQIRVRSICTDSSLEDLSEAQTRWEKMDNPFHASFVNADIFKVALCVLVCA